MKTKSLMLLFTAAVASLAVILFGFVFVHGQVGAVKLTEETLAGDRSAAIGLTVGYRADAGDDLHWITSYDYASSETTSEFKRGEMACSVSRSVYEDFRFTGWSSVSYTTLLDDSPLDGLQNREIQRFYDDLEVGASGKVKLSDYLDNYPVSFRFQLGTKILNSDDALLGLKIYEESGDVAGKASEYDEDIQLYEDLNHFFRIPVVTNAYQKYEKSEDGIEVKPSFNGGEDYYQFDPIIVLQEENLMDGIQWIHPDLTENQPLEEDGNYAGKMADQYNLKNRLIFIVNNRTARGKPVDMSRIERGYGIYELPIETRATASVRYGKRSTTVPNPKPLSDQLAMVYPLDEKVEYVEMTMSPDHRFLAVFFVRNDGYFVEFVDADMWKSRGIFRMFDASTKMTYTWGDDCCLATTNFQDEIAVFTRANGSKADYYALYCGSAPEDFDNEFFDDTMMEKANAYAAYRCGLDNGLAITGKYGKIAFVQNPLMKKGESSMRDASLQCAVIDKQGILYWGKLDSNLKDRGMEEKAQSMDDMIVPVRNENWVMWK